MLKTKTLSVRVTEKLHDKITEASEDRGLKISDFVIYAISYILDKKNNEK